MIDYRSQGSLSGGTDSIMLTRADIQLVKSLADRRARREYGLFVAEGRKMVEEMAASGLRIARVFCTGELPGMACEHVSPREMERLSHLKTPAQVVALVETPRYEFDRAAFGRELCLALDGVQDPGNLGTIIRLADWFGIRDVACSEDSADCFNPKVVQATMGAITRVRVHYTNLGELLAQAGAPVYGTFLDGEDIYRADLTPGGVLVMGSEGRGVSPEVARTVTRRLFIPPYPAGVPASESLNVAVAAAVACSEFRRRR